MEQDPTLSMVGPVAAVPVMVAVAIETVVVEFVAENFDYFGLSDLVQTDTRTHVGPLALLWNPVRRIRIQVWTKRVYSRNLLS